MPAISVIIPVYRVERYLDACVASVVAQTFRDLEIVLVDDGSPDDCPALCEAWARKDPRIRVVHRENGGLSAARNSGLAVATGQFVTFLDADDTLEPDTLRQAWEAQQAHNAEMVIINLVYVDENDQPLGKPDFNIFRDEVLDEDGVWQRYFALGEQKVYYAIACSKLIKADLFRELRFREGKRYEDQFLMPHLLHQCHTIVCLAYPGYRYIQHSGSIMAQGSSRNYLDRSEFLLEWCDYFADKGDMLRAEGLLNDAIQNLSEKYRFDLSTAAQQQRYRTACRGCAAAYGRLARRTGQKSMWLRAALLRLGLSVYLKFLHSRQ